MEREHSHDRSEDLLLVDLGVIGYASEDGGGDKVTLEKKWD